MNNKVGIYNQYPTEGTRYYEQGKRFNGIKGKLSDKPLVTVITVVYNNEETLQRCINSVVDQTYSDIEYIIIDGGSSDGTLDIIKRNIKNIDYALSEKDKGIYHAMNKGISLAKGDYIAMINSDDWLELDGIEESINTLIKKEADVLIGYANVWDRDKKFSHVWEIGNFDSRILMSGMSFCHQAVIASKEAYQSTNLYDENMAISSDYKWIKELFLNCSSITFLRRPIVNFSFDGVSANNRPIWKEECKQMLCDMFTSLNFNDVSKFLEYIYKDETLDPHSIENLINSAENNHVFLKSIALVLLDRLYKLEKTKKPFVQLKEQVKVPKISVVIPVYNVENYIEECLISVLKQSLKEIEVVIVDDGSPDNSVELIKKYMNFDPRIKLVQKENGGLSSARNAGVHAATGEYIHFLDSDDYINEGMYDELYQYANTEKLDIVKSNLGFIDNVYPIKKPALPTKEVFNFQDCPSYLEFISPCAALYKREFLNSTALFPLGITYEDRPFNWDTILKANRIGHVDKEFYMYRVARPDSIMNSNKSSEKHFDAFECIDLIEQCVKKYDSETVRLEFIKEQLRLYSMLVDIQAIPKALTSKFFTMCRERTQPLGFTVETINRLNVNVKHKILFEYLTGDVDDDRLASYKPLFEYSIYAEETLFLEDACHYLEYSRSLINNKLPITNRYSAFVNSFCKIISFDYVHSGMNTITKDELTKRIDASLNILSSSKFDKVLKGLSNNLKGKKGENFSLVYQHSNQVNYSASTKFIMDPDVKSSIEKRFVSLSDLTPVSQLKEEDLEAELSGIYSELDKSNIKASLLNSLLSAYSYIENKADIRSLKLFYILFPYSPFEMLLNNLKAIYGFKSVFVPHGLPQRSFTKLNFDYVFSFTNQICLWKELFPHSQVIHTGWSEAQLLNNKPTTVNSSTTPRHGRKVITFLSQLSGSQLHRVSDFETLSNQFFYWALKQNKYAVNIRLRNIKEKELINEQLLKKLENEKHIKFTEMDDGALIEENFDLLVGITSTGLLHAQSKGVASLQITSDKLHDMWPYDIASSRITESNLDNLDSEIDDLIKKQKVKYNHMRGSKTYMSKIINFIIR